MITERRELGAQGTAAGVGQRRMVQEAMGNTLEQWRSSIGRWSCGRPRRSSSNMFHSSSESGDQSASVPMLNYFMLAVLASLLVIAGVETNPGPVNNGKQYDASRLEKEQKLRKIMDEVEKLNAERLRLEQELHIQYTVIVPTAEEKTFTKTIGHADMSGELYEVKVAALLFGRALNRGGDFHLASNMKAAGAFDDIVLTLGQRSMFLQLKHRTGISKINKSQLLQLRGKLSLLKYYKSYCEIRQQWAQNEDLQHCGRFEDAIFVIYTNATIDSSIVTQVGTTDDWRHVLNTGAGMCHRFIGQSTPDIYEFLKNVPEYIKVLKDAIDGKQPVNLLATVRILLNNNIKSLPNQELRKMLNELPSLSDVSDHREFLSRLWLLTAQASEEELDDLIKKEIKTSIGRDLVYDRFQAEVQKWWKDSNLYLMNNIRFWQEIVQSGIANISEEKLKEIGLGIAFNKDECVLVRTFLMFVQTLHIIPEATAASTILTREASTSSCRGPP